MNTRFGFFPYGAMNYKAAQAGLDRRAAQGWALKHVYFGCIAWFRRAERPSHFVDLDIRSGLDEGADADYLQLCADAGWELVQTLRGMLLFRAMPGQSPAPIQTDGALEWERFWEKYRPRLRSFLAALLATGLLAFALSLYTRNIAVGLASNVTLLYLLYVVLTLLHVLVQWLHSRWYLAKCRRAGRVETPGPAATILDSSRVMLAFFLSLILFYSLAELLGGHKRVDLSWYPPRQEYTATVDACREWPVVLSSDLGLPDSDDSRRLEGFGSILMEFLEYREIADGEGPEAPVHILTTERYDCAGEGLARWTLAQRREETRNGSFLWGELEWEDAPGLGFDESFVCRGGSYLLFRQGRVVALVGCSGLDLTAPQHLAAVRSRVLG